MLYRIRLIASVGVIALATGATVPSARAARSDDACSLATRAQVGAAVMATVAPGLHVTPTFKKTCTWTAAHAANGVRIVTLSLEGQGMYAAGKRSAANPGVSVTPLGGIGDEAYYLITGNLVSLHLKKGGVALKVAVYARAPVERIRAMEKALAQVVVAHL